MNTLFFSFLLLLLLTISMTTTHFASAACTEELIAISPCLSYISTAPNNLSSSPSSECCEIFSSSLFNGTDSCLCHLVRIQFILGFPLNSTRIGLLPSLCSPNNASTSNLEVLCQGLTTLPPMGATPEIESSTSPSPSIPLGAPASSPSPTSSSPGVIAATATIKPAHNSGCQLLPPITVYFLFQLFTSILAH